MQKPSHSKMMAVTAEELLPLYQELFPRAVIQAALQSAGVRLYWRLLTPLVVIWCLIYQRLQGGTCDQVVCHLHSGALDGVDPHDAHADPLSKRLRSESSSAYVQGRQRLPLQALEYLLQHSYQVVQGWLHADRARGEPSTLTRWHGHAVRLLDGTSFRTRPAPDLIATYGQAENQHGPCYWVTIQSTISTCLFSQMVVAHEEGPGNQCETATVATLMARDAERNSIYVADRNFGIYRTAQGAQATGHHLVVRLKRSIAGTLLKSASDRRPLESGADRRVLWVLSGKSQADPSLPVVAVAGRLLYHRLQQAGFRPIDLYLFTTLLESDLYPLAELVELYGCRWQVELSYRHMKSTLQMSQFDVQSVTMFQKELAAALLTYNLVCACMTQAALQVGLRPTQLSFSRCWHRIQSILSEGVPAWVIEQGTVQAWLLGRLSKCRLPNQPTKVKHEPRQVRRRPVTFPTLKGDRAPARQQTLLDLAA